MSAGEHDDAVLPLRGVRVLDLTHVWSGPMSTRVLTGLGAEVLKLESPLNPDMLRGNGQDLPLRYPELQGGPDPRNRNAWFNTQNTGKRDVAINIKDDDGLALVRRLVPTCDLVIANYRPGVLDRLGLGFAALRELNPRIVLVEMPGYVADSPQAKAPAFGAQFDATSGNAAMTGDGAAPLLTGYALGDPVSGLFGAAAAVTAMVRARTTGTGCHVVLPQSEAMIPLLGEYYLAESVGAPMREALNDDRRCAPHGIYRTAGDRWLALAIADDAQWAAFAARLEAVAPGMAGSYRTHEERRLGATEIERAVRAWAATIDDPVATAHSLQDEGIPAAPLQDAADLSTDPQLAATEYFRTLAHPSAGTHPYPTLPIHVMGRRATPSTAAPRFAEDTEWCLRDLLGLDDAEIADLADRGVVALRSRPDTLPPGTWATAQTDRQEIAS